MTGQPPPSPLDVSSEEVAPRNGTPPFAASVQTVSQEMVDQWLRDVVEGDATVRLRAVLGCRNLSPERAAPILTKVFDSGENELQNRSFAALFLGYKPNARSFELLTGLVESDKETDEVRANAVAALGYLGDSNAVPLCLSLLRNPDTHWSTRSSSADAIGIIVERNPQIGSLVFDDLLAVLREAKSTEPALVVACIGALGEVRDPRCVIDIASYLDAADFTVAQCACEALGKIPSATSEKALAKVVDQKEAHINVLWSAEIALKSVRERLL